MLRRAVGLVVLLGLSVIMSSDTFGQAWQVTDSASTATRHTPLIDSYDWVKVWVDVVIPEEETGYVRFTLEDPEDEFVFYPYGSATVTESGLVFRGFYNDPDDVAFFDPEIGALGQLYDSYTVWVSVYDNPQLEGSPKAVTEIVLLIGSGMGM